MPVSRRIKDYSENKLLVAIAKGAGFTQVRTAEWSELGQSTVEKWWNDDWVKWASDKVRGAIARDQADFAEKTRTELETELKKRFMEKTLSTVEKGLDHVEWGPNQWAASAVLDRVIPKTQRTEQEFKGEMRHTYELPEAVVAGWVADVKQLRGIEGEVLEAEVLEQSTS